MLPLNLLQMPIFHVISNDPIHPHKPRHNIFQTLLRKLSIRPLNRQTKFLPNNLRNPPHFHDFLVYSVISSSCTASLNSQSEEFRGVEDVDSRPLWVYVLDVEGVFVSFCKVGEGGT